MFIHILFASFRTHLFMHTVSYITSCFMIVLGTRRKLCFAIRRLVCTWLHYPNLDAQSLKHGTLELSDCNQCQSWRCSRYGDRHLRILLKLGTQRQAISIGQQHTFLSCLILHQWRPVLIASLCRFFVVCHKATLCRTDVWDCHFMQVTCTLMSTYNRL